MVNKRLITDHTWQYLCCWQTSKIITASSETPEVHQLILYYWGICTLIVHHRDIVCLQCKIFLLFSALSCMKSFVWLTFLYVLPMFKPSSSENESNTFSHSSVKITTWNISSCLNTVCCHPFQCGHEQVNLIHDCRHTSSCDRRQDWQETDRWKMYFRRKWFRETVDHFE